MIEFIGLIIAIMGTIWARKTDIASSLVDPDSLHMLEQHVTRTPTIYRANLHRIIRKIDKRLQSGFRPYFAFLFLSVIYSSSLYLASWSLGQTGFLTQSTDQSTGRPLLLFAILVSIVSIFYAARSKYWLAEIFVLNMDVKLDRRSHYGYNLSAISVLIFSLSVFLASSSIQISILSFVFSSACVMGLNLRYVNISKDRDEKEIRIRHVADGVPIRWATAAAFAPVSLYVVISSLLSKFLGDASGIVTASVALFSVFGGLTAYLGAPREGDDLSNCPVYARPALYCAVHINNNFLGFCIAVSGALVVPHVVFIANQPEIAVVTSILCTAAIFASGAATLAGSGVVMAFTLAVISFSVYQSNREIFFDVWALSFLFWVLFPFVNALFDMWTWLVSRFFAVRILSRKLRLFFLWIAIDLLFAFFLVCLLAFVLAFLVASFEALGNSCCNAQTVSVVGLLDAAATSGGRNGMWAGLMVASTLIPTLGHLSLAVSGGVTLLVRPSWRRKLRQDLHRYSRSEKKSQYDTDVLAWKLAVIDPVSGAFIFTSSLVICLYSMSFFLEDAAWAVLESAKCGVHLLQEGVSCIFVSP